MFFELSAQPNKNFSYFYRLGNLVLSTDAGWHTTQTGQYHVVYKGYADCAPLLELMDQIIFQTEPMILGNFCAIIYDADADTVKIHTDRYRSFPIYFKNLQVITNLIPQEHTAWTDSLLEIAGDLTVTERKFDVIGEICTDKLTKDQVVDQIDSILQHKTKMFLSHNTLPVRAYLSGGIDSLLVYSYLQKFTNNFELVNYSHIDYDEFWLKNSGTLKQFWGYSQIHHWQTPCVLTSGAPGDEFMLRSPTTCDLYLKSHGLDLIALLDTPAWKNCLHKDYFEKSAHMKIFKSQTVDASKTQTEIFWDLCNTVVNDWQHWHLGHTLTWTPLRDLDIFKLLLRLPVDAAITQIFDSAISKRLIDQNKSGLCAVISDKKNSGNYMKNLCGILL